MELIQVYVSAIAIDKEREHPVVLLKAEGDEEIMPIWIGPAEASAIYTALSGSTFERPMTHDLLKLIVEELGAVVSAIEITGMQKDTYFARIILQRGEEVFYIDARPSDSISLALRCGSPLFMEKELFHKFKRDLKVGKNAGEEIKKHFRELDPGEFGDIDL
ncbi:MAG: bifunctional nuclease family protein [Candidatus Krumholzibacteriota bacterium]|nr:bifunctional nuclease family protein [Candidatus Krumholzibacteriota bacterium]